MVHSDKSLGCFPSSVFSLDCIFVYYQTIYIDLNSIVCGILPIIDFIQCVYYARKFYLHLKSREKDLNSKYL